MRDEEIKRLLENVEVQPSAHCWEAISSNIAAGTGAAATSAAKVAGHALSTTAKVIIGAVGAAAIATTAVILAVTGTFSPKETVTPEKQIVVIETTRTDETVPVVEENVTSVIPAQPAENRATPATALPSAATADESPVAATTSSPAPSEPAPKIAEATTSPAPTVSSAPKATTYAIPANASAAPSTPKSTQKPTATSEAVQASPLTDLSDPVLEDAENLSNIDFTPPVALFIPNIITPNGDGYNDVFIIQGIEQTDRNRLIIRNSSGSIVFQTVNYQNNWGAPNLAAGTYFYQFVYTLHGIDETRTGTLTIMR